MKNWLTHYYDHLFALLVFTLPISVALPNLFLGVLGLIFVFQYKRVDFRRLVQPTYICLFGLFSFLFAKALLTGGICDDHALYTRYLIVLLIPFLFLRVERVRQIKGAAVLGVVVLILLSVYKVLLFYRAFHTFPLADGRLANALLLIERPYAGFFATIAAITALDLARGASATLRAVWYLASALSVGFIFTISARTSLLTIFAISLIYVLFYLRVSRWLRFGGVSLIAVVIGMSLTLNTNLRERVHMDQSVRQTWAKFIAFEPRAVIWPCALGLTAGADFNWMTGYASEKQIREELAGCYEVSIQGNDARRGWFLEERFNTHNQFLAFFLAGGLVGLSGLVAFFYLAFRKCRSRFFEVSILVSILSFFIFENVLTRQQGCYVFTIFVSFLLLKEMHSDEKNKDSARTPLRWRG